MTTTLTLHPSDAQRLKAASRDLAAATHRAHLIQIERDDLIRQSLENGATLREVAEAVGMSHQMVHKIVKGQA